MARKNPKTIKEQITSLKVNQSILFPIERLLTLTSLCSSLGAITGNKYSTHRIPDAKKVRVTRVK